MLKMKLPNGKVLSVSTSPISHTEKTEEVPKQSTSKSDVTINIYGGNNSIAPNAEKAEQNIQTSEK